MKYWPPDSVSDNWSDYAGQVDPAGVDELLALIRRLVAEHRRGRQLGVLGEPRVNVLTLNLALDEMKR